MSSLEQGDVIEIDFSPSAGHEPAKKRPAVVVSGYGFNTRSSLVTIVPLTSKDNGYPLHIRCEFDGASGFACVEQMRNVDIESRGYAILGCADNRTMRSIMSAIRGMLELR